MVGKKSIFFTFLGIFVVAIMLIFVSIYTHVYYSDTVPTTQLRFNIAEDFIESFENGFLPRGLHAISHDSLGAMITAVNVSRYSESSTPYVWSNIDNEILAFQEVMLYGYINESRRCVPGPCTDVLNVSSFQNQTFVSWMNNLTALVWQALRLNVTYNVSYIDLKQNASDGPWHVSATLNLDYTVFDNANQMSWTRNNITVTARIPIEGFVDPYVRYQSNRTINNVIRKYNYSGVMRAGDVKNMIDDEYYVYDSKAPSFLQRFGRFGHCSNMPVSSCCGISSLVKPSDLNNTYPIHATKYSTRSYVDFWYYQPRCEGTDLYSVNGVSELSDYRPFRIDQYHISLFNILPNETALRSDFETNPCGEDDASPLPACIGVNCGDGVLDAGEECDDGDTSNTNACTNICMNAKCGDGYLRTDLTSGFDDYEECDDGNIVQGDGCNDYCDEEICGNGVLDAGEECDDWGTVSGDGCSATCQDELVILTKILCNSEADLPNWGGGSSNIISTTAQNYVDSNPNCDFESGWSFQWNFGIGVNPGDNLGVVPGWNTVGPTDINGKASISIDDMMGNSELSIREVVQGGYIPFSASGDISAELYCHNDVIGYDNFDYVFGAALGNTYYCVAFNAPVAGGVCGDSFVEGLEACDDSNTNDCDGCRGDCSAVETGCGDGFTCGAEQCDDGNADPNDGCTACQHSGTLTVCKIVIDKNDNVITGNPGRTLTIPGVAPEPITTTVFTTPISHNEDLLYGDAIDDGECIVYTGLQVSKVYYYGEETIVPSAGWNSPRYNDYQFILPVMTPANFFSYGSNLDSDGQIWISTTNPNGKLAVLNQDCCNPGPGCIC